MKKSSTFNGVESSDKESPIFYLTGALGEKINRIVQDRYGECPSINRIKTKNGTIVGSTPFYVVAVNEVLREMYPALRIATLGDLETNATPLYLKGTCEHTGLILRSEKDKDNPDNNPIAEDLAYQMKYKRIPFSPREPIFLPLDGLDLKKENNPHGLSFKIRDGASIYKAPVLAYTNEQFSPQDLDLNIGLPRRFSDGERTIYSRDSGLSSLVLGFNFDLHADYKNLAETDPTAKIPLVNSEEEAIVFSKELTDSLLSILR